ncbi:MAG: hypothetical protein ACOYPR_14260 [Saprospiraceae bacterium]
MKNPKTKLILLKTLHTIIWLFFNVVLGYMAYAVITDRIDQFVWIGIGLVILEGVVLLIFNKMCPLTLVARQYSDSTKDNFDIYLPNWLAKYNKLIYTTIFILIVFGVIYRVFAPTG